mgnify:CR=1 FL=1
MEHDGLHQFFVISGRPNAAVFPVPVCARATTSLPFPNKYGITSSCTGIGFSYPNSSIALRISGETPSSSNVFIQFNYLICCKDTDKSDAAQNLSLLVQKIFHHLFILPQLPCKLFHTFKFHFRAQILHKLNLSVPDKYLPGNSIYGLPHSQTVHSRSR